MLNVKCGTFAVADLGGGDKGRAPPPLDQNFFIFMQFSGKFGQIIGWRPPPPGLAHPPLGNPRSATVLFNTFEIMKQN